MRSMTTARGVVAAAGHVLVTGPVVAVRVDARVHLVRGGRGVRTRASGIAAVSVGVRLEHLRGSRACVTLDGDHAGNTLVSLAGDRAADVALVADSVGEGGVDVGTLGVGAGASAGGGAVTGAAHVRVDAGVGFVGSVAVVRACGGRGRAGGSVMGRDVTRVAHIAVDARIGLVGDVALVRASGGGSRTSGSVMSRDVAAAAHVRVDARVSFVGNVAAVRSGSSRGRARGTAEPSVAAGMAKAVTRDRGVVGAVETGRRSVAVDTGVHLVGSVAGVRASSVRTAKATGGVVTEGAVGRRGVVGGIVDGVEHRHLGRLVG